MQAAKLLNEAAQQQPLESCVRLLTTCVRALLFIGEIREMRQGTNQGRTRQEFDVR